MKVFLGGTCHGYRWRDDFVKLLNKNVDYFNPVVKVWNEEAYQKELIEREQDDVLLYVISDKNSVYSIAEVVDDSNKRPNKTVLCILKSSLDRKEHKRFQRIGIMVEKNGGKVFYSLEDTAKYINSLSEKNEK